MPPGTKSPTLPSGVALLLSLPKSTAEWPVRLWHGGFVIHGVQFRVRGFYT